MTNITAEMEAELVRVFERFDTDRSGYIEEKEFGLILDSLGYDDPSEVRSLEFAAIDTDVDGKVRFREFADWWLDSRDWRS
jgi:Ca2+-binding EF-hand superfamily protein